MFRRWLQKAALGIVGLAAIFIFNYFVRVDVAWRLKSAEAKGMAPVSQTSVHFEQTQPVMNMQEETYILYSDLDGDGDLDIAYTTNSPIRFIENKTVENAKN